MSILGYSSAYFLPEYWSNTPFYGEKIIPLLDYVLSTDFAQADKLANAFYMMENKYKNTADLPIDAIKAIVQESGYGYVLNLLGRDEESIRLLVYLLVLIHQLKGTKLGIEVVLNLLRKSTNPLVMTVLGNLIIDSNGDAHGFSSTNYILYKGFTVDSEPFELTFQIRTPANFDNEQAIASSNDYGFYLGITSGGNLVLCLGSDRSSWNIVNRLVSTLSLNISTNYYVKLTFDGYEYIVKVAEIVNDVEADKAKYTDYVNYLSQIPIGVHSGFIYLGVDGSSGSEVLNPYQGYINLKPFATDVSHVTITQWFEKFPVGAENTFNVKADLDLGIVSTDFFEKFADFVSKYVYPTLEGFEARLNFKSNLTFLPYVKQSITYVASSDVSSTDSMMVKETPQSITSDLYFMVLSLYGYREEFQVLPDYIGQTDSMYVKATPESTVADTRFNVLDPYGNVFGFEVIPED